MTMPKYTPEQEKWIDENYPKYRFRGVEFAEAYNLLYKPPRTLRALQLKAFRQFTPHCRYTKPQDVFLKAHAFMDRRSLTKAFNSEFNEVRTERSISQRLQKIGAIKWTFHHYTEEEKKWFADHRGEFRRCEVAEEFYKVFGGGHTVSGIRSRYFREPEEPMKEVRT